VRETIIPYGSFGPNCEPGQARQSFLALWPELAQKRILLTLGRIHPKKGTDLLIEAFARVCHTDRDFQLVIAGPDQCGWKAELEQRAVALGIAERITWTGMLRGELKWGAMAAAELFVLPSHQENFGIVVAEALSCGLPVLISNRINIWREIARHWAGLVEDDSVEGVTAALQRWTELTAGERQQLGQRSRLCFDRHFNLHINARRMVDTVLHLVQTDRPTADAGAERC
jgi:glycosyltransferase involved in cell wall biosynthesis